MVELAKLVDIVGELDLVPDISKFDPKATFSDNGIDSLDQMNIFLAIEEHFGVKFTEEELEPTRSIADVAGLLNARGL